MSPKRMRRRTVEAIADCYRVEALDSFARGYLDDRSDALGGKDFDALVRRIREIKADAVARREELWHEFARNAERSGAAVHFTADAGAANHIIESILTDAAARKIVKSKSMLTEELHLNEHLHSRGFDVIETDLGERIIQLDAGRPSHVVMPAIHKTAASVAETLGGAAGIRLEPDIPSLVAHARERLRDEFYAADAAITGANAAIASTGALMIVTNEGNARMATIEAPMHIAVVGLEKIAASTTDALAILELLPPSATGQRMTSYVSLITGPLRDAQHIVVVDNGRSRMAGDPPFDEALYCIRCGACLNVCPVYLAVGGHVFGHIYMGGIGSALTAFHHGPDAAAALLTLCLGCRACIEICPAGIEIPLLVETLRRRRVVSKSLPYLKAVILRRILRDRKRFHSLLKAVAVLQPPFTKAGYIRHLPLALAGLGTSRALPALADKPLRERVAQTIPACDEKRMRIGLFSGCLIDFVYPDIGEKIIDILTHFGCEVVLPQGQTCCGLPAMHEGEFTVAAEVARDNLDAFAGADVDAIITGCASCASTLKRYPELLADDKSEDFASNVHGICDFLCDILKVEMPRLPEHKRGTTVTYHDSCHLRRRLGAHEQPRKILEACSYELREHSESDRCCGFAGAFSLDYPELSSHIGERKIASIKETGAQVVAMDCPGCILQIRGLAPDLHVAHTVELVWEGLFG